MIEKDIVYDFEIEDKEFFIRYSKLDNILKCIHLNDEDFEDDIIIEESDFFEDKFELFEGYILTKEYYDNIIKIIKDN